MTKTFKQYLDRVDLALASLNGHRNDDDLRLWLFCRLWTVGEHQRAKVDATSCAAMLYRQYRAAVDSGNPRDCWWRFNAGL